MDHAQERKNLSLSDSHVPTLDDQAAIHGPICRSVAPVLNRVGDKWSVLIITMLGDGPRRFNELKRMVNGISQRMLTLTLRNLERYGLVTRTVYPEIPPRVEYELTDLGRSLQSPINALWDWAASHQGEVQRARVEYDGIHDEASEQHPPERRYAGAAR